MMKQNGLGNNFIMSSQNYTNHKIAKKGVFTYTLYASLIFILLSIIYLLSDFSLNSVIIFLLTFLIGFVLLSAKVIANKNQDRIIRMEMRFRYYILTNKRFEEFEKQLRMNQIVAIRFADDEEIVDLINKTISENLSADSIKKEIKKWQADHQRV